MMIVQLSQSGSILNLNHALWLLVSFSVGVVKIGMIFTDGKASRPFDLHLPTLENLGVTIFAIPINSEWSRSGLEQLASTPPGLHVLTDRGIHSVDYLIDTLLSGRICRGKYVCTCCDTPVSLVPLVCGNRYVLYIMWTLVMIFIVLESHVHTYSIICVVVRLCSHSWCVWHQLLVLQLQGLHFSIAFRMHTVSCTYVALPFTHMYTVPIYFSWYVHT